MTAWCGIAVSSLGYSSSKPHGNLRPIGRYLCTETGLIKSLFQDLRLAQVNVTVVIITRIINDVQQNGTSRGQPEIVTRYQSLTDDSAWIGPGDDDDGGGDCHYIAAVRAEARISLRSTHCTAQAYLSNCLPPYQERKDLENRK